MKELNPSDIVLQETLSRVWWPRGGKLDWRINLCPNNFRVEEFSNDLKKSQASNSANRDLLPNAQNNPLIPGHIVQIY